MRAEVRPIPTVQRLPSRLRVLGLTSRGPAAVFGERIMRRLFCCISGLGIAAIGIAAVAGYFSRALLESHSLDAAVAVIAASSIIVTVVAYVRQPREERQS